jgi:hypothetical protein
MRFDFAALLVDCIAGFFKSGPNSFARAGSGLAAVILAGPTALVLILGEHAFGQPIAFAVTFVAWPVLLEIPGAGLRRQQAMESGGPEQDQFDFFLLLFLLLISAGAAIALFSIDKPSDAFRGVLWGASLAGAQDVARSCVAFALALTNGFPVYRT